MSSRDYFVGAAGQYNYVKHYLCNIDGGPTQVEEINPPAMDAKMPQVEGPREGFVIHTGNNDLGIRADKIVYARAVAHGGLLYVNFYDPDPFTPETVAALRSMENEEQASLRRNMKKALDADMAAVETGQVQGAEAPEKKPGEKRKGEAAAAASEAKKPRRDDSCSEEDDDYDEMCDEDAPDSPSEFTYVTSASAPVLLSALFERLRDPDGGRNYVIHQGGEYSKLIYERSPSEACVSTINITVPGHEPYGCATFTFEGDMMTSYCVDGSIKVPVAGFVTMWEVMCERMAMGTNDFVFAICWNLGGDNGTVTSLRYMDEYPRVAMPFPSDLPPVPPLTAMTVASDLAVVDAGDPSEPLPVQEALDDLDSDASVLARLSRAAVVLYAHFQRGGYDRVWKVLDERVASRGFCVKLTSELSPMESDGMGLVMDGHVPGNLSTRPSADVCLHLLSLMVKWAEAGGRNFSADMLAAINNPMDLLAQLPVVGEGDLLPRRDTALYDRPLYCSPLGTCWKMCYGLEYLTEIENGVTTDPHLSVGHSEERALDGEYRLDLRKFCVKDAETVTSSHRKGYTLAGLREYFRLSLMWDCGDTM